MTQNKEILLASGLYKIAYSILRRYKTMVIYKTKICLVLELIDRQAGLVAGLVAIGSWFGSWFGSNW